MNQQNLHLERIRESITRIESFTADGWDVFNTSRMRQDAVLYEFSVIGHAWTRLALPAYERRGDLPVERVAALGDVNLYLAGGVDIDKVWESVQRDLPTLKGSIEQMLDR